MWCRPVRGNASAQGDRWDPPRQPAAENDAQKPTLDAMYATKARSNETRYFNHDPLRV